jgi:hypothetical protein
LGYESEIGLMSVVRQLTRIESGELNVVEIIHRLAIWAQLELELGPVDRLKIYQKMRRHRHVPEHIGFFLVARTLVVFAEEADEPPDIREMSDRIQEIERAHGLRGDEYWHIGEGQPEWEEVQRRYSDASDEFHARVMREHGEDALASMYMNRRDEFRRRYEEGRMAIFGPIPSEFES